MNDWKKITVRNQIRWLMFPLTKETLSRMWQSRWVEKRQDGWEVSYHHRVFTLAPEGGLEGQLPILVR